MAAPTPSPDPQAGQAPPPWPRTLLRAWRRRCPRCGEGALFQSAFRLRQACPACQLTLRAESGSSTGQMYLSAAITEFVGVLLAVVLWHALDWSVAATLALAVPLVAAFSFWFLPKAMALWVAVEYLTDRHNEAMTPDRGEELQDAQDHA